MHILMADDDKEDYFILQEAVAKVNEPLTLSYAANWLELWRATLKAIPDILFLDLNMPVKNGLECLRLLREESKFDMLPIIIYSTSASSSDIDEAYAGGANYFAVKPYSLDDITTLVIKLIRMGRANLITQPPREEFVII